MNQKKLPATAFESPVLFTILSSCEQWHVVKHGLDWTRKTRTECVICKTWTESHLQIRQNTGFLHNNNSLGKQF